MYENQSLLDSHPDLLVHILVKMGLKDQKMFDKRVPKDQDPTQIMGQKHGQKMNNAKMAVIKIELGVKQGGQKDRASLKVGGGANPQNIHIHLSIYDCITLSIISSSKVHMYEGGIFMNYR